MERCYFAKEGFKGDYNCSAITDACEGFNPACKFYKTKEQYITQRDKAIDRCREKGLCSGCQYRRDNKGHIMKAACQKNDEVKNDN